MTYFQRFGGNGENWKQTCWKIILNSVLLVAACLIIAVCITNIARMSGNACNSISVKTIEENVDRITLEHHKSILERRINATINRIQGGQTFTGTLPWVEYVTQLYFASSDNDSHIEGISTNFPKMLVFDEMRKTYSSSNPNVPPERQFLCTWQMWKEEKKDSPDHHFEYRFLRQDFIQPSGNDLFSCSMTIPSLSVWEHRGLLVVKVHPWGTMGVIIHQAAFDVIIDHAPGKPTLEANQPEVKTEDGIEVYEGRKDSSFTCRANNTFPGYPEPDVTWWSMDEDEEGNGRPGWNGSTVGIAWNAYSRDFTKPKVPLRGWIWCEVSNDQGVSRSNRIKIMEPPKTWVEYFSLKSGDDFRGQYDHLKRKTMCPPNILPKEFVEEYRPLCSIPIIRAIRFVPPKEIKRTRIL